MCAKFNPIHTNAAYKSRIMVSGSLASRGLALVAYLLFFSVQICFRYSSTQSVDLDQYSSLSLQQHHVHGVNPAVHSNPQKPGKHILNKRYQPVDTMPAQETACVPERPVHCIRHIYFVVDERPVQSDHTTALLRGPPAAIA